MTLGASSGSSYDADFLAHVAEIVDHLNEPDTIGADGRRRFRVQSRTGHGPLRLLGRLGEEVRITREADGAMVVRAEWPPIDVLESRTLDWRSTPAGGQALTLALRRGLAARDVAQAMQPLLDRYRWLLRRFKVTPIDRRALAGQALARIREAAGFLIPVEWTTANRAVGNLRADPIGECDAAVVVTDGCIDFHFEWVPERDVRNLIRALAQVDIVSLRGRSRRATAARQSSGTESPTPHSTTATAEQASITRDPRAAHFHTVATAFARELGRIWPSEVRPTSRFEMATWDGASAIHLRGTAGRDELVLTPGSRDTMVIRATWPPPDLPPMLARDWAGTPHLDPDADLTLTVSLDAPPAEMARTLYTKLVRYHAVRGNLTFQRLAFDSHVARSQPMAKRLEQLIDLEGPMAPTRSGSLASVTRGGAAAPESTICVTVSDEWAHVELRGVPLTIATELIPAFYLVGLLPRPTRAQQRTLAALLRVTEDPPAPRPTPRP